MRNLNIKNQIPATPKKSNIGEAIPKVKGDAFLDTGETKYIKTEDYKDYLGGEDRGVSAFPFMSDYNKARALGQSNWEQAGKAVLKGIMKVPFEIAGQAGGLLDFEDYVNTDDEFGNWLTDWSNRQKEGIDQALPIYQENPEKSLQVGDFAWWMENGSNLVSSATAFAALGYATGAASLASLTKGAQALKWIKTLGQTTQLGNQGSRIVQGAAGLANAALLNHAEGYGIAVNVYNDTLKEQIDSGKNEEEAKIEAARQAENALNSNKINILLNLSSASLFLKAPKLTRQILKSPSLKNSIKRTAIEGLQEAGEEVINLAAEKNAEQDDVRINDFVQSVMNAEGLESALLGFIGGAAQTGFTLAGRDLKLRRNSDGTRISDNQILEKNIYDQEQAIKNWDNLSKAKKVSSVTDAFNNFYEQQELQEKFIYGDETVKNEIKGKLLYTQAYNAFNTGTTEQLLEVYKGFSSLTPEQASEKGLDPKTYKKQADKAINLINTLEDEYIDSRQYSNPEEVYNNRAEVHLLRNDSEELIEARKVLENKIINSLKDLGVENPSNLKEHKTQVKELGFADELNNLSNLISYKTERLKTLTKNYAEITSDKYQKEVKTKYKQQQQERVRQDKKNKDTHEKQAEANRKNKINKKAKETVGTAKPVEEPSVVDTVEDKDTLSVKFPAAKQAETALNNVLKDTNLSNARKFNLINAKLKEISEVEDPSNEYAGLKIQLSEIIKKLAQKVKEEKEQKEKQTEEDNRVNSKLDTLGNQLENFSPLEESRDKTHRVVDTMYDVFSELESKGIDVNNFVEVGTYLRNYFGKDRFINLYPKFRAVYNLVSSNPVNESYEELFLDLEESQQLIREDDVLSTSKIPSQLHNMFEDELLKELDDIYTQTLKEQGFKRYEGENIEIDAQKAKLYTADDKIAHLDKKYKQTAKSTKTDRFNVLDFVLNKEDLDNKLNKNSDSNLLDYRQINVGSKIRFVPLNQVIYDDGSIVYKDGTIEKDGKITKENPVMVAPIGVEYNGEIVKGAFLHLPDWINNDRVLDNVAEQKERLIKIRKAVLDSVDGLETTITKRGDGFPLIDVNGFVNLTSETLPEVTIGIGKDNSIYTSKKKNLYFGKDFINEGRLYAVYPVNKDKLSFSPLQGMPLSEKPAYVTSLLEAVQIYLDNFSEDSRANKIQEETGIDIRTLTGLEEYFNLLVYAPHKIQKWQEFRETVATVSDKYPLLQFTNYNMFFSIGDNNGDTARYIDRDSINKLDFGQREAKIKDILSKLEKVLNRNLTINASLNYLNREFKLPIITKDNVDIQKFDNYNTFVKNHSYTANYSAKLDNGNTIYTIQSTLEFDVDSLFRKEVPTEIVNEITDSEDINETISDNNGIKINLADDLTSEEDFAPKELSEEEFEKYRASNPDVLNIQGVPIAIQEAIVDHIYSEVLRKYVKEKDNKAVLYIGEFLNTLTNVIKPSYEKVVNDNPKYKANLQVVNTLIDNYTIIEKLSFEKLQTLNNLVLDKTTIRQINEELDYDNLTIDELVEEDDNESNNESWQADRVFKEDYRNKISVDVKNIFSYIPDIDPKTGKERKTIFNLTKTVPLETVINDVSAITAYNNYQIEDYSAPDFDILLDLIKAQIPNKPYLVNVVKELKAATEQTKNKFVRAMSKHYTHHEYGLKLNDNNILFLESDRNNVESLILNEWLNGLILSPLVSEVNGEFIVDNSKVDKLDKEITELGDLIKSGKDYDINRVVKVFSDLGLNFNEELINKINTDSIYVLGKTRRLLQLFKDSDGLVKLYINRLKELKGKSLQDENPFNNLSSIKAYAKSISKVYPNYYANSFKDVRGANYWGYTQNKLLIDRLKELKSNPLLTKKLKQQPFTSQSFMLSKMLKDDNIKYYTYNTLDGESFNGEGKKFQYLSKAEQEEFKLQLFFSKNKYNRKTTDNFIIKTFYPTTSDKSVIYAMTSVGQDIRPYVNNGELSPKTLDLLYESLVKPELLRILDAQSNPEKYDYKGLREGSKMFMLFPILNSIDGLIDWETGQVKDIRVNKAIENDVKNVLKNIITDLANKRLAKWREYNFINKEVYNDGKGNEFTKETLIHSPRQTDYTALQEAFNYEVNYLLFNMGVFQLFTTDPALYWKSSHWKTVANRSNLDTNIVTREDVLIKYTQEDWIQEHLDSFDNMGKRLAADVAPGEDLANSENESFNVAHVADNIIKSTLYDQYKVIIGKEASAYAKMNATDAQEFTTLEEHLNIMVAAGELSKTQKNELLNRESKDELTKDDFSLIFGEGKALNPHKLRYALNIFDKNGLERRVYIKSSSFPLIKQLTKGLEIDKLREGMLVSNIQRVTYDSAFKIGGKNEPLNIFQEDGKVYDNIANILEVNRIDNLPRNGHKIQQQVPYKENKDFITNPTQLVALITASVRDIKGFKPFGKELTGKEIQDEIDKRYVDLYKEKTEQLVKELEYDYETQTFNINKLRTILREEGIKRGYSLYDLLAFNVKNGKFEVPLWATGVSSKIQALLNSIVDNRIRKHKPRGMSNVLGSSHGFTPVIIEGEEASNYIKETTGIVFNQKWLEESNGKLRPMRIEAGEIKPAEVIAPFRLYDDKGNKLNIKDYIKEDGTLDMNNITDEVLEILGFRIPTQGLKSMSYIKIVGFLPEHSGDLLLAPSEFTVQMGSDFDVDKLYSMMYHTKVSNNKVTKLIEGDKLKVLDNELLDLYMSILKNPSERVQKQIIAPLDFGMLLDLADEIYPKIQNESTLLGITENYQSFKYNNAKEGKIGVGVFSNDMRLMANLAEKGIAWINEKGQPIYFSIGGKTSTLLSYPYTKSQRLKSNVIEAYQSLAVDNENEQGMHKLNINQDTFSFIRAMAMSGFEEDIISYVLAQPIIRDYVEYRQSARDGVTDLQSFEIDGLIKNKYPSYKDDDPKIKELELNTRISKKELIDGIDSDTIDNESQRRIYALFKYLSGKGSELQDIQTAINTFNKGIGKNLFYSFAKENQLKDLVTFTRNYSNLFSLVGNYISLGVTSPISTLNEQDSTKLFKAWEDYKNKGKQKEFIDKMLEAGWYPVGRIKVNERYNNNISFIKPSTVAGLAMVNGTIFNNQLWEDLFPYKSVSLINTIEKIKAIRGLKRSNLAQDSQLSESIFNSIKSYLSTKAVNTLTDGTLADERKRLLLNSENNMSLAHIVNDLRQKNKYKNLFLNRLELDLRTSRVPSMIRYKAGTAETLYERQIYQSFNSMLNDNKEIGTYNGITYTPKKLAQDLITHQFLTGGIQGANEYIKYIPINYLNALGFYKELEQGVLNKIDSDIVAEQTIQHNPRLVHYPSITSNTDNYKLNANKTELELLVPRDLKYISLPTQDNTKGYYLYKKVKGNIFKQISVLGYKDFLEYNYNVNEATSVLPSNNPDNGSIKVKVPTKNETKEFYNIAGKLNEEEEIIYRPNKYNVEETYNLASGDIPSILNAIAGNTESKTHKLFLGAIIQNIKNLKNTRLILDNNLKAQGSFNLNDNTIKINPSEFNSGEEFEKVFLEEIIHALTKQAILANKQGEILRLKGLLSEAEQTVKNYYKAKYGEWEPYFIKVVDKVQNQQPLTKEELDLIYPIMNMEEFVGRLFKSKDLQKLLNDTPSNIKGISLWQKFKNFIRQILDFMGMDIKKDSVLDYSLSDILSLIATAQPSAEVQAELKKTQPIGRTIEFLEDKYNLRDEKGNLRSIENAQEVANAINRDIEGVKAEVLDRSLLTSNIIINKSLSWKQIKELPVYSSQGVNTMRKNSYQHFGNPFTGTPSVAAKNPNLILMDSIDEAVEAYKNWLLGENVGKILGKYIHYDNVLDNFNKHYNQYKWILNEIHSGKLDNTTLLYMNDRGEYKSHAEGLKEVVEELRNSNLFSNKYVKLTYTEDFSPKVLDSTNIDSFKRNINRRIKFIQDSIDKATAAKDYKTVEVLKTRLNSLRDRTETIKNISSLTPLIVQGKQDMEHLNQIFKRGLSINDAIYVKEVTDYWTNLDQLLFSEDDRYSDSMKYFKEIEVQALQYRDKLHQVEENYTNQILKDYGKQTTVQKIFDYYKDINYFTSNTLDISRYDNPILSNLLIQLKEANMAAFTDTNTLLNDLSNREKELDNELKKLGYDTEDRFNIFRQQDSKGRFTNHLVQRYDLDYLLSRGKVLKALKKAEGGSNKSKYNSFLSWARDNTYELDLNLLFNSNDIEARNSYITKLKEDLGDIHFEEVYNEQKDKIDRYKEQYKNFQDLLLEQHSLKDYKDLLNNQMTKEALLTWVSQHSPFAYQKHLKSGLNLKESNLKRFRNTDYLVLVQKDKTKYDNNFKVIESNKVLYDFYKYFVETDKKLQYLLPEKERLNLAYYGIPYLPYTTQNLFRQKGYKAGLAPIYDAVQRSIRVKGEGKEDINPITDRPYRSIDISLTKDNSKEIREYVTNKSIEYQYQTKQEATNEQIDEWRREKIHELAQKNSFDLPAVLRMYALTTYMYSHKAKVEDYMRLIQNIFDRQKEIRRNSNNEVILKDNGEPDIKESSNSFKNTKASLDYLSETFYGISKKNERITDKKVYTSEEKQRLADLDDSANKLEIMYKAGTISEEQYQIELELIEYLRNSIGGVKVYSRIGDGILKYVQLKGMGWNLMSSIANVGFGLISNYVEAAGGLYYTRKSLNKAYAMVRHSILRNATFNRYGNDTAIKIRKMMDKWDVLKDASKELFNSPFDIKLGEKHEWLAPYNLTQRTEYLNQAPLMIALLLDKKLEDGTSYWDALDENGNWKKEYGKEPTEELNKLRLKLDQLIKSNHGNYDPVSSLRIKDKFIGRAMSQFRTWMFEGIANRFESKKYDDLIEDERKGRYRTYGDFFSENGIKGILTLTKGFIRSATLGKVFNGNDFSEMDRIDAANMRKNMAELVMLMNIYLGYIAISAAAGGLDDEDDKFSKYVMNTLLNQGLRLKTDILFYTNPSEFRNLMRDLLPVTSLIADTVSWMDAVGKFAKGEDIIETGVYSGHSRLLRESAQLLPFGTQVYKNINYGIQAFD